MFHLSCHHSFVIRLLIFGALMTQIKMQNRFSAVTRFDELIDLYKTMRSKGESLFILAEERYISYSAVSTIFELQNHILDHRCRG
jgi:hypothetical protein